MLNVSLPVDPPGRIVPLGLDVIAAGVAVTAFSIFFSMPLRMLAWPVVIGMLAHALRWLALAAGADLALGAFVACVVAGLVLLSGTIANGIIAINIILAMSFGLLVPKIVIDRISGGRRRTKS